ncbi:MAG: GNAT family N-acetyltransferase [Patescibacteria group bacterium]|nr:GNAT family N-acetyltransferase [Patescibacteria group bacterium]
MLNKTKHKKLKPVPEHYIETLNIKKTKWSQIKDQILYIENSAFSYNLSYEEEDFEEDFFKSENVVVLLKLQNNKIIGYAYAKPRRSAKKPKMAHIMSIAILKDYQKMGLGIELMDRLEFELKKLGYISFVRESVIKNDHANKVRIHYGKRIFEDRPAKDNEGDEDDRQFFKIKL